MVDVNLFAVLTAEERSALEAAGVPRRARRGAVILAEGQPGDRVAILRSGRAKVVASCADGGSVVLGFAGPGSLVGEQAVFDGRPRSASVVAIEPVELLAVAALDFRRFLAAHPRVGHLLLGRLSARLRDADRRLVEWSSLDTLGRVAARLVELCEQHGEPAGAGVRITLPLTQEDLAGWTGSSRESTVRALRTLRELGWIATGRRSIVVRDLEAVRRRA